MIAPVPQVALLAALHAQRTVRKYAPRLPDDAIVQDAIRAAQRSPSTSNHQPYSIIQIKDRELRGALIEAMVSQPYVSEAPLLFLVCVDWSRQDALARVLGMENDINRMSKLVVGVADASIFAHSFVLALQAYGLGTSYIASPYTAMHKVAGLLGLPPDQVMPLHMISAGYPDESVSPKPRYATELLAFSDRYRPPAQQQVAEYFHDGSKQLEESNYFKVTGDLISTWREHYQIKFGETARLRTWEPLARDLNLFFRQGAPGREE